MRHTLLIINILFTFSAFAQSIQLKGKITDAQTGEALAFVNIAFEGSSQGTVSDIDGKFKIDFNLNGLTLVFSYVGYEKYHLTINDSIRNLKNLNIFLHKKNTTLREVVIYPGENPAHRIIRNVINNRETNNPEKLNSFSYTSYNKMHFSLLITLDSLKEPDTNLVRLKNFTEEQHILMLESVSERNFLDGKNNEKIIASKMSGFKDPSFAMLATQIQSFSFYNDYVSIYEKKYLNPISKGSTGRYSFSLEDTIYSGADTVFIISFQPQQNKNFDGLKGLLYINTNKYAVQNVIAEPFDDEAVFQIKIQQKYEFVDSTQWFPVQLNTDITYKNTKPPIIGIGRSYLNTIKINPELNKKQFNRLEVDFSPDAGKKENEFWDVYRSDSLNSKEKKTYHVIDSIGEKENLDVKLKAIEAVLSGKLPAGCFDFDIEEFVNYNEFEGWRLGAAVNTNRRFSENISFGGMIAYGFRDKALKYGGDITLMPSRDPETNLKLFYTYDVRESGGINFDLDRRKNLGEHYREYLINKMDYMERSGASINFRAFDHFLFSLTASQMNIEPTGNYRFGYASNDIKVFSTTYNLSEARAVVKFAFREKFIRTPRSTYSLGTNYPVVWLQVSKGFDNVSGGDFNYLKFDLKIEKEIEIKQLGKTTLQAIAGHVDGKVPYTLLYAGRGSFRSHFNLSAANTFETMGMNEFLSSTYGSFFLNHDFGNLLFKMGNFKPELVLVSSVGWGTLSNPENHHFFDYKTMEKTYLESGFRLNNILKINFLGIGIGGFYRYGAYSSPDLKENVAVKITVGINL